MSTQQKMTKQGVRDLNHLVPKKRPVVAAPEKSIADEALPVPLPAAVPAAVAVPPTEV
jgi:hypothetical protein